MGTMNIELAYQQALLSNAAYITWTSDRAENKNRLINQRGFTEEQAEAFVVRYAENFNPNNSVSYSNGFSATVFTDIVTNSKVVAFRGTEGDAPAADNT